MQSSASVTSSSRLVVEVLVEGAAPGSCGLEHVLDAGGVEPTDGEGLGAGVEDALDGRRESARCRRRSPAPPTATSGRRLRRASALRARRVRRAESVSACAGVEGNSASWTKVASAVEHLVVAQRARDALLAVVVHAEQERRGARSPRRRRRCRRRRPQPRAGATATTRTTRCDSAISGRSDASGESTTADWR